MPTEVDNYRLLQSIGQGQYSKVYLAQDINTLELVAAKLMERTADIQERLDQLLIDEVSTLKQVSHPNVVNILYYNHDTVLVNSRGETRPVLLIVTELAQGGHLFDLIHHTQGFGETISRFYGMQLVNALNHIHNVGVVHRDIKPNNILMDSECNLKYADFGFSAPIMGRDYSGFLRTRVGTYSYLAPEMWNLDNVYEGSKVDVFSLGVVIFNIVTGASPFQLSVLDDHMFSLLSQQQYDTFWETFAQMELTKEFKDLMQGMLNHNPEQRYTLNDIQNHVWFQLPVSSHEQIKEEVKIRMDQLSKIHDQTITKVHSIEQRIGGQRKSFRSSAGEEECKYIASPYIGGLRYFTELLVKEKTPDECIDLIRGLLCEIDGEIKQDVSIGKAKIKGEQEIDERTLKFKIEVFKLNTDKCALRFTENGPQNNRADLLELFIQFKDALDQ